MNALQEAEQNIAASAIYDPKSTIPEISLVVGPEDFFSLRCAKIVRTVGEMLDAGDDISFITVADRLGDEIPASELAELADDALPSCVRAHAQIVKRESARRSLLLLAKQAIIDLESKAEVNEVANRIDAALRKLTDSSSGRTLRELLEGFIEDITIAEQGGAEDEEMETGITELDKRVLVLLKKCLTIIAGRPGMGKTALALQLAVHNAKSGISGLFFTMESRDYALINRMLSSESGINNARVQTRRTLTSTEADTLKKIAQQMMDLPITIKECRDWEMIKAAIRDEKRRDENLGLVFIDYCQLIRVHSRTERYLQIGEISGDCKALAMELNICVVLLSQLNRDLERRENKRPLLADLRESGNLEQDGDVILLLHRPSKYDLSQSNHLAEIDCAKNRDGASGIIPVRFDESIVKWS